LVPAIMSLINNNFLSFSILLLIDIKNLLVLGVNEILSFVFEDLPPFWCCSSYPHLLWTSTAEDCPWVAGPVSRLDGSCLLIEPEGLSLSTISSLDMEVSVGEKIEVSLLA
jgi:hypothetical protein